MEVDIDERLQNAFKEPRLQLHLVHGAQPSPRAGTGVCGTAAPGRASTMRMPDATLQSAVYRYRHRNSYRYARTAVA